ncbi:MAG TPA: PTS N-acetylglucosamine transporter subunit IIBC [Propionibacteriaceae bacterium]|nr:PTS transporter subunit EIIC [Micropruina sp.]HBX81337.1 PTS N-acetylglucosamine transporter subunit IIBC [Propionibacteriaceae bacterium]HBY22876.1 PTS N-acetylglucosamine transporter subunit IIBC [Propionibacteriaceae bacterium]HBY24355.1 PTS N-acetylglucosamine transporter subunit IIBC [Propionibacteriaceae bacterium]
MLPIASLPAAALLLRLGQDDLLGKDGLGWNLVSSIIGAAGGAIFGALPLLFAVGVAIGMAKKADGSTALATVVGYLVFKGVSDAMSPVIGLPKSAAGVQSLINYGVLGGIVMGVVSGLLWQKFYRVSLPPYLAFFGGRRFVPMITALAGIVLAVGMAFVYPAFNSGLTAVGNWVAGNVIIGGFVYGTLNRLLIPLGLHHILNNPPWFILGDFTKPDGTVVHGDIARFLAHDPTAGTFMTGFFPIMMFALPAAALAIWQEAKPKNKKAVGGIMISVALTAFLTGVTEPLEFAFMFVAWPLYVLHAVLTGLSLAITNGLGIHMGFGFSAGLFDFLLNWNIGTNPWMLIPIGLAFGALYYIVFRVVIRKMNLKTPGREDEDEDATDSETASA